MAIGNSTAVAAAEIDSAYQQQMGGIVPAIEPLKTATVGHRPTYATSHEYANRCDIWKLAGRRRAPLPACSIACCRFCAIDARVIGQDDGVQRA